MYQIEFEPPVLDPPCDCCGDRPVRLTRFLTHDDEARGVYFALYSNRHSETGVHILLSLGPWWDGTIPAQRNCFYFR
ncbi:MAG: hypothetical protein AAFY88_20675, partial [Acidobacteriota bacterium]